jgi:hypothetical protein
VDEPAGTFLLNTDAGKAMLKRKLKDFVGLSAIGCNVRC